MICKRLWLIYTGVYGIPTSMTCLLSGVYDIQTYLASILSGVYNILTLMAVYYSMLASG